jgi:hypothetical protein
MASSGVCTTGAVDSRVSRVSSAVMASPSACRRLFVRVQSA